MREFLVLVAPQLRRQKSVEFTHAASSLDEATFNLRQQKLDLVSVNALNLPVP
jgi:hypothetical protein